MAPDFVSLYPGYKYNVGCAVRTIRVYIRALRKRNELAITDTELKLMATAASIGDINMPVSG